MILQRIEGSRFSRVRPDWNGRTVAILAGGPSLQREHFARVRLERDADRLRVIAINDSYLLAPWADVHYAADAKWHRWHTQGIDKPLLGLRAEDIRTRWAAFMGQKCTIETSVTDAQGKPLRVCDIPDSVHAMRCVHGFGLSVNPEFLVTGKHGGFQALNLATLAGASRVLLLGVDAKMINGLRHWHGEHPTSNGEKVYAEMKDSFAKAADDLKKAGVEVINCSLTSAIDAFPRVALEEAL